MFITDKIKKVLVVGGGGREHAIIWKLAENPGLTIFAAPGNGGISKLAQCFPEVKATDIDGVLKLAKELEVDMVAVIPDDPLALGMVDALNAQGIRAFGPTKDAARLESSKCFSKDFMVKYGIPTAAYKIFTDYDSARAYLETAPCPIVVKADGLAVGKGAVVAPDREAALAALKTIMMDKVFGASGNQVVIEECMSGPEVSVLAFCDGKTLRPMVSSMDHKRAFDGDLGPNTGGMGTIAPSPLYTESVAKRCEEEIFLPTLKGLEAEGITFKGCIYFGLMLTENGPKVIEYNARFGDPETQVVLPLMEGNLLEIMDGIIDGRLAECSLGWKDQWAACVVVASGGYPGAYETGKTIKGLAGLPEDITVFHAGTKVSGKEILSAGGRVLGVVALGNTLPDALDRAYEWVPEITFHDSFYRKDIGKSVL